MTSPKIIRERRETTDMAIRQHRLLSAAYSLLQQNYGRFQLSVRQVSVEENYSILRAVRILPGSEKNEAVHIYSMPELLDADQNDRIFEIVDSDRKGSEADFSRVVSCLIKEMPEQGLSNTRMDPDPFNLTLFYSAESYLVSVSPSSETELETFRGLESGIRIVGNFPHPYVSALDPLIKYAFVSMNYARMGKSSLSSTLYEAAAEAYAYSVGEEREKIRSDFSELLEDMDRAGLITARGNEIYFSKNSQKFQRAFIRKYWDYVEKIGKRTLFDFESPF